MCFPYWLSPLQVLVSIAFIGFPGNADRGEYNTSALPQGKVVEIARHGHHDRMRSGMHASEPSRHPHDTARMLPSGTILKTRNATTVHGNEIVGQSPPNAMTAADVASLQQAIDPIDLEFSNSERVIESADLDKNVTTFKWLVALAGGTGATIGATGILALDEDLVRRMRYQDKAVMFLLMVMYFLTLAFSASFAYRQALNDSPVTFYADPRYHDMVAEGRERSHFLDSFGGPPKDVHLRVAGFMPVPAGILGSIEWQGEYYYDAWSFALDVSPWVVREESTGARNALANSAIVEGIVAEDLEKLEYYINQDTNDLAVLELHKETAWPAWDELATNIKHKIRQEGFAGIISVHRTDTDVVSIYKNTAWANFMHSRTTKVLCALSVLGWLLYLPYMWLRCTTTQVRSRYTIEISIQSYWQLIVDKLTADGFVDEADIIVPNVPNRDQEEESDALPQDSDSAPSRDD